MEFVSPLWLVLLAFVLWIVMTGRRAGHSGMGIATRAAIAMALAFGAAGTKVRSGSQALDVVFVMDRSASVAAPELETSVATMRRLARNMAPRDRAGVVVFARDAVIDQPLASRLPSPVVTSAVARDATNLETALQVARAALGREGTRHIVVLSDGHDTHGEPLQEAALAAADDVRIDAVPVTPMAPGGPGAMQVMQVTAPAIVRVAEPYRIDVDVAGVPRQSGSITIRRDGGVVAEMTATMDATGRGVVRFEDGQRGAGAVAYTAYAGAAAPGGADRGAVVVVEGSDAILHVGSRDQMSDVLRSGGFRVSHVLPAGIPALASGLSGFTTVVLDDVGADALTEAQNLALARFVKDSGGGLMVLGGPRSLGPAGYPGTPIGDALPIDLRPGNAASTPAVALVVVFDKSGSMADRAAGLTKIELARRAVLSTLAVVPPGDPVGVIAFDSVPGTVVPLSAGHSAATLAAQLQLVQPGGATAIAPAIETALQWLRASSAARHQLLVLSDGRSTPADAARLLTMARTREVEWSIVSIGPDADRRFLTELADASGGRVYFPAAGELPQVAAREAARSTGGSRAGERFTPRFAGPHPVLAGLDGDRLPALTGYVDAAAKENAAIILAAHETDPVFAAWPYGLGRVAVFDADIPPEFRAWPGFAPLMKQTTRWLGRARDTGQIQTELKEEPGGARLVADVTSSSGAYVNRLAGEASIRDPEGRVTTVAVRQTEPGRYEARVPVSVSGPYLAALTLRDPLGVEGMRVLRGWFASGSVERQSGPADVARLRALTDAGGGTLLDEQGDVFNSGRAAEYRSITGPLVLFALLAYFGDLAVRRGVTRATLRNAIRLFPGESRDAARPQKRSLARDD